MKPDLIFFVLSCCSLVHADEPVWPNFRGPGTAGISDTGVPVPIVFDAKQGFVWKQTMPAGKSSPILAEGKLFLTGHEGKKLFTLAVDPKTGKELWRGEVEKAREEKRNRLNDPAAATPVTDGKIVVSFFADFGLVAYSIEGKELWRVPLGPFDSEHGMSTSPALGKNSVFVLADVSNGSFLAAFDKKTGQEQWRLKRRDTMGAYASPTVYQPKTGPEQVIASGPFEMAAFDTSSGEKIWWVTGLPFQPKSNPLVIDGVVYVNSLGISQPWADYDELLKQVGKGSGESITLQDLKEKRKSGMMPPNGYLVMNFDRFDENKNGLFERQEWDPLIKNVNGTIAVKLSGKGDQTGNVLWRHTKSLPDVPEPLVYKGIVYLVRDGGIFTALDAKTGEVLKQGRLRNALGQYFASPIAAGGNIYVANSEGTMTVIKPGADWEVLSLNEFEEPLWATPAVHGSDMFIRAGNTLYCFRGTATQLTRSKNVQKDMSAYQRLTGEYVHERGFKLTIALDEGMLVQRLGTLDVELVPAGTLVLKAKNPGNPVTMTFIEENGIITALSVTFGNTPPQTYKRVLPAQ
jgi:outer membrane protein assembly factor BamB